MATDYLPALPYFGGKDGSRASSRWIAAALPQKTACTYIEPFAGMLGILRQRPPALREIANDKDAKITDWWTAVRDYPQELERAIALTPYSREEFRRCVAISDDPDAGIVERARAVHTLLTQSRTASLGTVSQGNWFCSYTGSVRRRPPERIAALAQRLRDVQLTNKDACEILARVAHIPEAVIYCDPPYSGAYNLYGADVDRPALLDLLLAQKGRVAISGYAGDWDATGWRSVYHPTVCLMADDRGPHNRTEWLWMNYPDVQQSLPGF